MNKNIRTQRLQKCSVVNNNTRYNLASTILGGVFMIGTMLLLPEVAYAAFEFNKVGDTWKDVLKKGIDDYYGIGVVGFGAAGSMVAQGDLRTKALGFTGGALIAGIGMTAARAGFGV